MKIFLSLFLLLSTAFYILPVKEILTPGYDICMADMDEDKEESNKKEKTKDLFFFNISDQFLTSHSISWQKHTPSKIPVLFHLIETPPPDNNG